MKKELDKKYNHLIVEKDKYKFWLENDYFKANIHSKKPPYSIVIPPPNVTGKLHLGHAWDGTLQDALIRYKKLSGFDTLYLPGMDHAGIATQVKVEQRLKEQKISRFEIGRDAFVKKVWEWKDEYAQTIRNQWEKLGLSLDYSLEKFTYSPEMNKLVNKVFVEMYNKGLIYKDKRIVNWDPVQKTAISNIEVIYKETKGGMYHFKYFFENDKQNYLIIATTRPETMFGDACVVVNPNDKRYQNYIGKKVINPVNNQLIPIIADEYVDVEFGTGVMKCTPAHDPNDYIIGKKYNLDQIICMNIDGTMNEKSLEFKGLDRFEARKQLVEKMQKLDLLIKKEEIDHQVGYSERSNAVVEPYLSEQWFVKMDTLAKQVLDLQKSDNKINFYPKRFDDVLNKWMENINDWTISRQLWWGHQIPAWYNKNTNEIYVGEQAPKDIENWFQDEDVLDTWFSSALWPFATLNWNGKNNSKLFERYFPTNVLVTGYDIIFFWVARMVFSSLEFTKNKPFEDCLLHGLIRDEQGRKMSKSLGNGVDPMQVVQDFGADSMRYFLLTNSSPGQDLRYSEEKLRASWNFVNKIWNASRFVMLNIDKVPDKKELDKIISNLQESNNIADKWILNKLSITQKEFFIAFDKYEFTLAGKILYNFIWDDFCNWYLELSKAEINSNDINAKNITLAVLGFTLKQILLLLHPLMPFVSEEIYQLLDLKTSILEEYYEINEFNYEIEGFESLVIESIKKIREFRLNQELKNELHLTFNLNYHNSKYKNIAKSMINDLNKFLKTLVNSAIELKEIGEEFTSVPIGDCFLEIANADFIDNEKQIIKLEETKVKLEKEIERSEKILINKNFLEKADVKKIELEKHKAKDYKTQYNLIIEKLNKLKN
ncbi:valine--tRNA ligase [Spiroplasma tabanidicola]|uniref:Valine--tRNA ligase n=1 Tax=Spiroplasma tabanidicola TaxID=324079 RepID=A0A6I6CCX4_9MOLU|nr:valine--tRNA ligase [Spiroplasma tabanidicola]QGS51992.1 valyl-tRNA synthetase [Spiroplasma tabanidicola]